MAVRYGPSYIAIRVLRHRAVRRETAPGKEGVTYLIFSCIWSFSHYSTRFFLLGCVYIL